MTSLRTTYGVMMMSQGWICICLVLVSGVASIGSPGSQGGVETGSLGCAHGVKQGAEFAPIDISIEENSLERKIRKHSLSGSISNHTETKAAENIRKSYVYNHRTILDVPDICEDPVFLLVFVCSGVRNFKQRNAIRKTWGGVGVSKGLWDPLIKVKVLFVLGDIPSGYPDRDDVIKSVSEESLRHNDVIQEDFVDSYRNLTLKSMAWLKWTTFKCRRAKYVLKTDDDTFINLPLLVNDLRNTIHRRFIMGNIIAGARPTLDKDSKYYTPKSAYDGDFYPKYMSGSAYVISGDLVHDLYAQTKAKEPIRIEDIYITGILAEGLGDSVHHIFNGKFGYKKRTLHPCLFKHVITGHYVTPPEMLRLWQKMQSGEHSSCDRTLLSYGNMDGI